MLPHDEQGTGPAVVLLHAGIADRRMWADLLPRLAEAGYRAVALDLPGFGEAPPEPGPQAPWNDVLSALDALGIQDAALVGCSYGGAVALRAAALHRGRFWAMVLAGTPAPGLEPSPELQARWEAEDRARETEGPDAAAEVVARSWLPAGAPASVHGLVADAQRQAYAWESTVDGTPSEAPDPLADDPDRLTWIEVPTLVVAGDEDLVDFREGGRLLARLLPQAELTALPSVGHLPPLEQPAAFCALAAAFLARHRR